MVPLAPHEADLGKEIFYFFPSGHSVGSGEPQFLEPDGDGIGRQSDVTEGALSEK